MKAFTMAKVFITLAGTKHYSGNDFLEKGTKIRLEKEPAVFTTRLEMLHMQRWYWSHRPGQSARFVKRVWHIMIDKSSNVNSWCFYTTAHQLY